MPRENLQQHFEIFKNVRDYACLLLDDDGVIMDSNKGTELIKGYTAKELKGQSIRIFYEQKDVERGLPEKHLARARAEGSVSHEAWRLAKNRTPYWGALSLTCLGDKKGFLHIARDLTGQKKSTELLDLSLRMVGVGGWEIDVINNKINWADQTRIIHEVDADFEPDLESGINFYKEGYSRDTIQQCVKEAIEEGKPFDVKLQIITAKGNERWVRARGKSEFVGGKCLRVFGTFQDITEGYEKDLKLARSEASLRAAQKLAKIGSWEWYPGTNKVEWSDEMFTILGLDKSEHSGKVADLYQFIHPDDLERVQKTTADALAKKQAIPVEYRIITKEGKTKHIRGEGDQVLDEKGQMIKMFGTLQDITEYVKLENRLSAFFENTTDLMCIASADGYFLKLNTRWEETLGYNEDELKAEPFINFVHPDDREATIREASRLAEGNKTISFLNRYRTKTGDYRWLEWAAGSDPDEKLLFASARDITHQKESDKALKEYSLALEAKNKELEQFTYISSHDLQEPLRTIGGMARAFENKYGEHVDESGKRILGYINDAVERMNTLIKGLLDYSRLGVKSTLTRVDCNLVVQDVITDLQHAIEKHGAYLSISSLPRIAGYPTELRQLFQNLLANALKFSHKNRTPHISISAKSLENEWRFCVKDNGIGIKPEHQEKVFLIFQRLVSRSEYEGSGIGLAHCHKITQLHGGKIWVESTPGLGSSFYFTVNKNLS